MVATIHPAALAEMAEGVWSRGELVELDLAWERVAGAMEATSAAVDG